MDELKAEVGKIRQDAMERAAAIWEKFENLPQPLEPIDIYKATVSVKCAEFLARVHNSIVFGDLMRAISEFLESTLEIAERDGAFGSLAEGRRVQAVLGDDMPMTTEVFGDPSAYAERQHVYDGIIMLAAAKMGREADTKACLERMHAGIAKAMRVAIIAESFVRNPGGAPRDE